MMMWNFISVWTKTWTTDCETVNTYICSRICCCVVDVVLFLVLTDYVINDWRTVHIGLPIKRLLVVHKDRLLIGAGNYELALVNSFIYDWKFDDGRGYIWCNESNGVERFTGYLSVCAFVFLWRSHEGKWRYPKLRSGKTTDNEHACWMGFYFTVCNSLHDK